MAHRKIIEVTVKVVVDIDNDDIDAPRNSNDYTIAIEDKIESFVSDTDYSFGDTVTGKIVSTEVMGYKTKM